MPVPPAADLYVMPASFAQERLWFLQQLEPASPFYSIPLVLGLKGALDVRALQEALNTLVERHEALRTNFAEEHGAPVQLVRPYVPFALDQLDLSSVGEPERAAQLDKTLSEAARRAFRMDDFPLWRMTLIRLRPAEHVLSFTVHHAVFDGWSAEVWTRELAACYADLLLGRVPALPELPIQYADYALWQRDWLQGARLDDELAYWTRQLSGIPPLLELPTDFPRPPAQTFRGCRLALELPDEPLHALDRLARSEGATLFMALLASFQLLLSRYTGQTDVVVGAPIANRNRAEVQGLIGFFVNTLALRARIAPRESFNELLAQVRQTTLDGFAHQDMPFEKIVQALQPARSLAHSPLFQVALNFINAPPPPSFLARGADRAGELTLELVESDPGTAKFDLSVNLNQEADGVRGNVEYSTDLFARATIERLVTHWITLIESILARPDAPTGDLELMPATEREQMLVAWNDTASEMPGTRTLHRLFEEQVERTPDAIALVFSNADAGASAFDSNTLSFRELNARANQLARVLARRGVASDSRASSDEYVGVALERSPALIVALLAVLKTGAAYLPLDPRYPAPRLEAMLTDAAPRVVITDSRLRASLPAHLPGTICLDEAWSEVAREPRDNLDVTTQPDGAAYVLYTSGSTGKPKGVIGLHRSAVNRLAWMWKAYPFQPGEVCCQKTSLNFVDSVAEIFGPLLRGVPLVILPDAVVKDPRALVQALVTQHVTRLSLVPTLLRAIVDAHPDLSALSELRLVISSGEPLRAELAGDFLRAAPGCALLNLYGMTECGGDSTFYQVRLSRSGDAFASQETSKVSVPIGRPIANTQVYLLDENRQPVPVGVPGEIYIGGAGVAGGYLNQPDLTREKFVRVPGLSTSRGTEGEDVLYRTGDRARYSPDGNLEYLGRADDQVKIRGMRVEPGEVAAALSEHPLIARAAVVAERAGETDGRLIAYAVLDSQSAHSTTGEPSPGDLYAFLKARLPEHMLPSAFVMLDALPLTPSGKLDRQALPAALPGALLAAGGSRESRAAGNGHPAHGAGTPRTPLERQIAAVWLRVLKVDSIGVDDDFFERGGHSMLAIRLFYELEHELGRQLPLALLFQAPTIAGLAREIEHRAAGVPWSPLVAIQPGGNKPPLFCVHGFGGGVVGYGPLARVLGPDQPFYGLQARGQNGDEPDVTIEAMAARYLDAIRTVQPRGPYNLAGYCYGGTVALEIAAQLVAAGDQVRFLGMMENPAPKSDYRQLRLTPLFVKRFASNLPHWLGDFVRLESRVKWTRARRELHNFIYFQQLRAGPLGSRLNGVDLRDIIDDVEPIPTAHRRVMVQHALAIHDYFPKPYPGCVTVFRTPRQPLFCSHDPLMGWGQLAACVRVRRIEGTHSNILQEPYVHSLATALEASLAEA